MCIQARLFYLVCCKIIQVYLFATLLALGLGLKIVTHFQKFSSQGGTPHLLPCGAILCRAFNPIGRHNRYDFSPCRASLAGLAYLAGPFHSAN